MSRITAEELHKLLPSPTFSELLALEKLRLRLKEKVHIDREEWQFAFQRHASDGTVLYNEVFIRRANYNFGIVELYRAYYATLDLFIRSTPLQNFQYRLGSFNLIHINGSPIMLNGSEVIEFPKEIIPYFISSIKNKTYFKWQDWTITPVGVYFRKIHVDPIALCLFLELSS
ncbi:MAG: hypothetical protein ACK42C_00040 [Aquificaceae bacterium]